MTSTIICFIPSDSFEPVFAMRETGARVIGGFVILPCSNFLLSAIIWKVHRSGSLYLTAHSSYLLTVIGTPLVQFQNADSGESVLLILPLPWYTLLAVLCSSIMDLIFEVLCFLSNCITSTNIPDLLHSQDSSRVWAIEGFLYSNYPSRDPR